MNSHDLNLLVGGGIAITVIVIIAIRYISYHRSKSKRSKEVLRWQQSDSASKFVAIRSEDAGTPWATPGAPGRGHYKNPVARIADKLGISETEVNVQLGIPVTAACPALTKEEAESMAFDASSEEKEYAALLKWIELEDDYSEIENLMDEAEDYPSLHGLIVQKHISLLSAAIEKAASSESDLIDLFDECIPELKGVIVQKLNDLYK